MIIKIPRDKVEIIDKLQVKEDDIDVDIESIADLSGSVTIKSESFEPPENPYCVVKIEIEDQEVLDIDQKEQSIDEIVRKNIYFSNVVEGVNSSSDSDVDDAYADQDFNPGIENNFEESSVEYKINESTSDVEIEDSSDDDWRYNKKGKSKEKINVRKRKPQTKIVKGVHDQSIKQDFLCLHCNESFKEDQMLVKHTNRFHLSPYKCHLCPHSSLKKHLLKKHLKLIHGKVMLVCPLCRQEFTCLENLKLHASNVHNTDAFLCSKCDKVYTTELILRSHAKGCSKKKMILDCEVCGKVYKSRFTLEDHLNRHMGIKHECKDCGEIFQDPRSMYRHRILKHSGVTYQCDPCGRDFSDDRGYVKHMKLVHKVNGGMPEKYVCTMCDNKYWQKISLARHIKNYHSVGVKSMIITQKKYRSKRSIKTHKLQCDSCKKYFVSKNCLRDHLRSVHYGIYYSCNLCSKIFASKSLLLKHKELHTKQSFPYKNCTCKKQLFGHEERVFTCWYCLESFKRKKCLVTHIHGNHYSRVHNIEEYSTDQVKEEPDDEFYSFPEKY